MCSACLFPVLQPFQGLIFEPFAAPSSSCTAGFGDEGDKSSAPPPPTTTPAAAPHEILGRDGVGRTKSHAPFLSLFPAFAKLWRLSNSLVPCTPIRCGHRMASASVLAIPQREIFSSRKEVTRQRLSYGVCAIKQFRNFSAIMFCKFHANTKGDIFHDSKFKIMRLH